MMPKLTVPTRREIVLVGAGHSHVQTLARFAMKPPANARLTLVVDTPIAVYSGMVPGFVANQYSADELEIDALPLARRAGARVIFSPAVGVDPRAGRLEIKDRPALAYDLISFDIGSTVAGLELPGVRQHALPTRPIGRFVERLEPSMFERTLSGPLVVVGAGAGGVELIFALERRLSDAGQRPTELLLLQGGRDILPGYSAGLVRRVRRHAAARGIEIRCGQRVAAVDAQAVHLEDGASQPHGLLVWVTGAVSKPLFTRSGLATDERGFLRVRTTLQAHEHDQIFGVGDCATLDAYPDTPKAGVYAVRQGPFLTRNLEAALESRALESYRPQSDFLTLLNLGDGSAIGSKWGRTFEGEWVMRLKDRIDRRFMDKYQLLEPDGRSKSRFAGPSPMAASDDEMLCGGCAAKLGQSSLERVLERLGPPSDHAQRMVLGLSQADDAVAYRLSDGTVMASNLDSFRAFTDDPFLVGQVAANNAMSDLFAKGVRPQVAMALVQLEEASSERAREETLFELLAGARRALDRDGVTLAGGHTTLGAELVVGFSVEGELEPGHELLTLDRAELGQSLVLTRPLGTGVLFFADMRAGARGPWLTAALDRMTVSNGAVVAPARRHGVTAATDITGFGLAGHLSEILRASGVGADLWLEALPALDGALELLALGRRSTYHDENRRRLAALDTAEGVVDHPAFELLFDPQTAGGLLLAVAEQDSSALVDELREVGFTEACVIGRTLARESIARPLRVLRSR